MPLQRAGWRVGVLDRGTLRCIEAFSVHSAGRHQPLNAEPLGGRSTMMKFLLAALPVFLVGTQVGAEDLSLPFNGRGFVLAAGDTINVNPHVALPAQRYGIDFAQVGGPSGTELRRGGSTHLEDFFCWGEPVIAPTGGVVVGVVDDLPDQPLGSKDPRNPAGNHVVIQTGEGLFLFVAHLKRNTVAVKPGESVRRAQTLGLCGNSGNTDFPHIHLHLQDSPIFNSGTGQNLIFGPIDVELTGKRFKAVTWPLISGLFVSNTEKPTR